MDPLSIAASVVQITSLCLKTVTTLEALRNRYQNANITVAALCSESILVSASLSQIQTLFRDDNALAVYLAGRPELRTTLDTALVGCMTVFSCLDTELQKILGDPQDAQRVDWKTRLRVLWNEDEMKEYLALIRGQQSGLNLLLQGLQMRSQVDMARLLQNNSSLLERIADDTRSLRASKPKVNVPESIIDVPIRSDSNPGGVETDTIEVTSIIDDREFDFDDIIVNSKAYRKALVAATRNSPQTPKIAPDTIEEDLIDLASIMEEVKVEEKSPSDALRNLQISPGQEDGSITPRIGTSMIVDQNAHNSDARDHSQQQPIGFSSTLKAESRTNSSIELPQDPDVVYIGPQAERESLVPRRYHAMRKARIPSSLSPKPSAEEKAERHVEYEDVSAFPILQSPPAGTPLTPEAQILHLRNTRESMRLSGDPKKQLDWVTQLLQWVEVFVRNGPRLSKQKSENLKIPKDLVDVHREALDILMALADRGDADAIFFHAYIWELGYLNYKIDRNRAFGLYRQALERGCMRAAYRMGLLYEGIGQIDNAKKFYQLAADGGDAGGLYRVGVIMLLGQHSVKPNLEEAVSLVLRAAAAADQNTAQVPYGVSMIQAREVPNLDIPEHILPSNRASVQRFMAKSAFLGYGKAQYRLGIMYEAQRLLSQRRNQLAFHYLRLATWQGVPEAYLALSRLFSFESNGVTNHHLSVVYARRAAVDQISEAFYQLAMHYHFGWGVKENVATARYLYECAIKTGDQKLADDARKRIEDIISKSSLIDPDTMSAKEKQPQIISIATSSQIRDNDFLIPRPKGPNPERQTTFGPF